MNKQTLTCLHKVNVHSYLIIATDEDAFDALLSEKLNVIYSPGKLPKRSGTGWKWRLQSISNLLNSGFNILHSDLDAIWLKNPLDLIDNESDIIASMDRGGWPPTTYKKLGFTMCMGWIYFKSTDVVKNALSDIITAKSSDIDDQHEFNDYISDKVNINNIYISENNERFLMSNNIKVRVLNEMDVLRSDYNSDSYVCHPLIKKQANKENQLKKRKLWFYDK
jgi:hypothetical protein